MGATPPPMPRLFLTPRASERYEVRRLEQDTAALQARFGAAVLANMGIPSFLAAAASLNRLCWFRAEAEREVDAFLRGESYAYRELPHGTAEVNHEPIA
jgi:hypothetical protein